MVCYYRIMTVLYRYSVQKQANDHFWVIELELWKNMAADTLFTRPRYFFATGLSGLPWHSLRVGDEHACYFGLIVFSFTYSKGLDYNCHGCKLWSRSLSHFLAQIKTSPSQQSETIHPRFPTNYATHIPMNLYAQKNRRKYRAKKTLLKSFKNNHTHQSTNPIIFTLKIITQHPPTLDYYVTKPVTKKINITIIPFVIKYSTASPLQTPKLQPQPYILIHCTKTTPCNIVRNHFPI